MNMIFSPVIIFDNFFENPNKVRQFALGLEYFQDPDGMWPGKRTRPLSQINKELFHLVCKKYFSQFYDLKIERIEWDVLMYFQMISQEYDSGWVHQDNSQMTGIIYLNEDANLDGGTWIYKEKDNLVCPTYDPSHKINFFLGKENSNSIEEHKKKHNEQFEATIKISNVYNRLVSFDSHLNHSAQHFFGEGQDSRLTLVFFVNKLLVNNTPISRSKKVTWY